MSDRSLFTIGELADQGGVKTQTIRYYERRGLLSRPKRSAAGYRVYSIETIPRLRFIRQAQDLGFSLSEIGELLALRMDSRTTCADIRARARQKITAVDKKITELKRIREALDKLAVACRGNGPMSECPIVEALEDEERLRER